MQIFSENLRADLIHMNYNLHDYMYITYTHMPIYTDPVGNAYTMHLCKYKLNVPIHGHAVQISGYTGL